MRYVRRGPVAVLEGDDLRREHPRCTRDGDDLRLLAQLGHARPRPRHPQHQPLPEQEHAVGTTGGKGPHLAGADAISPSDRRRVLRIRSHDRTSSHDPTTAPQANKRSGRLGAPWPREASVRRAGRPPAGDGRSGMPSPGRWARSRRARTRGARPPGYRRGLWRRAPSGESAHQALWDPLLRGVPVGLPGLGPRHVVRRAAAYGARSSGYRRGRRWREHVSGPAEPAPPGRPQRVARLGLASCGPPGRDT